jgi:hypothetical protein
MGQTRNSRPQPSAEGPAPEPGAPQEHTRPSGRYRFCGDQPVDPEAGVHPEMHSDEMHGDAAAACQLQNGQRQANPSGSHDTETVPSSPDALIAMQDGSNRARPEKPERQTSANVTRVMELIARLDTRAVEDLEIAFRLVHRLESFHDEVVDEMRNDAEASHNQLIRWAIDADRLMQARTLLGNVDLE